MSLERLADKPIVETIGDDTAIIISQPVENENKEQVNFIKRITLKALMAVLKEAGGIGENGATFTPCVSEDGVLSWSNDKNLSNPASVTINGKDGNTPQKGVDYWTPEDIVEIKSYVDEAILGGAW